MTALITGASSGIGRDIATELSKRGYDLILVARRQNLLEELAGALPTRCDIICTDVSKPGACEALYERVKDRPIDILVNNAGFGLFGAFDETDLSRELAMLDTNIRAVHILTKLFLRDFKAKNAGYILNVASSAAFMPGPLLASYYASKAYVLRLSQAIGEELRHASSKVYIGALCPGPVTTEFDRVANVDFSLKALSSQYVAAYAVKRMLARKRIIIPGVGMKLSLFFSHFTPERMLLRITYGIQKRKQG